MTRTPPSIVMIAVTASLLGPRASPAGFAGVLAERATDLGTPECLVTYRVYALFDHPQDQLLAIGADAGSALHIGLSGGAIVNDPDSPYAGSTFEDFPSLPQGAAWDSFLTIGSDPFEGGDTSYSEGFGGGDGKATVLVGASLDEPDGGWFDVDLQTPVDGGTVLILQLTVDPLATQWVTFDAAAFWMPEGDGPPQAAPFSTAIFTGACEGDANRDDHTGFEDLLLVLSNWGPCDARCCLADLDRDTVIGFDDLLIVLENWDARCQR